MKKFEGLNEDNIRRTSIAFPVFIKEAMERVKEVDPKHISYISLIQFCILYPYTLGDFIFTLHVLDLSPKKKEKLITCFYHKDFKEVAKIIKEVLNRKKGNELSLKDVIQHIKKGEDESIEKIFQEIEDKLSSLKVKIKMRKN
jgi:hypothetical protein